MFSVIFVHEEIVTFQPQSVLDSNTSLRLHEECCILNPHPEVNDLNVVPFASSTTETGPTRFTDRHNRQSGLRWKPRRPKLQYPIRIICTT